MATDPLRVLVTGYGYWGEKLARVLDRTPGARVVAVTDPDPAARARAARDLPRARTPTDVDVDSVDAVAVATPASSHYIIAKTALEAGKHVIVTKPFTTSVDQAEELAGIAEERDLALVVDHTFLYTPAVNRLRTLYLEGSLGDLWHITAERVNLGVYQPDVSVLWDLATHDVSILNYVVGAPPSEVTCTTANRAGGAYADVAHLTLGWDDGLVAHVHASWLSPVKARRMTVVGSERMVVYDDVEPDEKLRVYDSGVKVGSPEEAVEYRAGDVTIPRLFQYEALAGVAESLVRQAQGLKTGRSARAAVEVVRVISAAETSAEARRLALGVGRAARG